MTRFRVSVAGLAVLMLLAVACGDDSITTTTTDSADSEPETGAADGSSDLLDGEDEPGEPDDPPDATSGGEQTPMVLPDLPATDDFCEFFFSAELTTEEMPFATSRDVEAIYLYFAEASARLDEIVPPEVADDWDTISTATSDFAGLLEELDWDFAAALESDDPRVAGDGEAEAADERVGEFCGEGAGDRPAEQPDEPVTESGDGGEFTFDGEGEGGLPSLGNEDLAGLAAYVDAVDELYLADFDIDRRMSQLTANCEWNGATYRLSEVALNAASRPGVLPEILVQHAYVCPGTVASLNLDLTTIDRVFEPDLKGLREIATVTNPSVVADEELFDRFVIRLEENCEDPAALRRLLTEQGEPPTSVIGWHVFVCPETVTQVFG